MAAPSTAAVAAALPAVTGGVLVAPKGTALPTSETTTPNAAFKALGYIGSDGVQPSGDAPSTDSQKAWGGDTVAELVTDKGTRKFTFTLLGIFDGDVANFVFGSSNVTVVAAVPGTSGTHLAITDKQATPAAAAVILDWFYQGKKGRYVGGNVTTVVTGEEPLTEGGLTAYTCECTFLPDSTGVSVYRYLSNDDF